MPRPQQPGQVRGSINLLYAPVMARFRATLPVSSVEDELSKGGSALNDQHRKTREQLTLVDDCLDKSWVSMVSKTKSENTLTYNWLLPLFW